MSLKLRNNFGNASVTLIDGGDAAAQSINVDVRSLASDVNTSITQSTVANALANAATIAANDAAANANAKVNADLEPYDKKFSWSHRNLFINGHFDVWQRGTKFTSWADYTADRWRVGGENSTTSRTAAGKLYMVGTTVKWATIEQRVEVNFSLSNKTFTFSMNCNWTGSIPLNSKLKFSVRRLSDDSEVVPTIEIPITFVVGHQNIVETFTIPPFTENAEIKFNTTVQMSEIVPTDVEIAVESMQLEEGSFATPFEQRPIAYELSLCQRYYEQSYEDDLLGTIGAEFHIGTVRTAAGLKTVEFNTPKRVAPAVKLYATNTGNEGFVYNSTKGLEFTANAVEISKQRYRVGLATQISDEDATRWYWSADAEL